MDRFNTTISFRGSIQSEEHPRYLDAQIEHFLASFAGTLADMDHADFETHKKSLIASVLEKRKNLGEETESLSRPIRIEHLEFDAGKYLYLVLIPLTAPRVRRRG